jgi:hypothetical protein
VTETISHRDRSKCEKESINNTTAFYKYVDTEPNKTGKREKANKSLFNNNFQTTNGNIATSVSEHKLSNNSNLKSDKKENKKIKNRNLRKAHLKDLFNDDKLQDNEFIINNMLENQK